MTPSMILSSSKKFLPGNMREILSIHVVQEELGILVGILWMVMIFHGFLFPHVTLYLIIGSGGKEGGR